MELLEDGNYRRYCRSRRTLLGSKLGTMGRIQGWQRRGDAEARGADFDASDGGAKRCFEVGGVNFVK